MIVHAKIDVRANAKDTVDIAFGPNNRRARIYELTAAGRKQLQKETERYQQLTMAIARVLEQE